MVRYAEIMLRVHFEIRAPFAVPHSIFLGYGGRTDASALDDDEITSLPPALSLLFAARGAEEW